MPVLYTKPKQMKPARALVWGFLLLITVGTVLLSLPVSVKEGQNISFVDTLFTAASASCVTGIQLFDTYTHWSFFGQCVLLLLIQVGGIGFLTLVTFFNVALGRKLGSLRMKGVTEDLDFGGLANSKSLFLSIVVYCLSIELLGALVLMFTFVPMYGGYGVFMSVFHAVSAFCNAGFDLWGIVSPQSSFITTVGGNLAVVIPLMLLIMTGGLGFSVWHDVVRRRKTKRLTLHTRIVLLMTAVLFGIGFLVYFLLEITAKGSSIGVFQSIVNGVFASVSTRTAGMVISPTVSETDVSKLFTMFMMFVGGAPASTAGGIKVTTFAIIIATVISVIQNQEDTQLLGCVVRKQVVYKTLTVFALALSFLLVSFVLVFVTNEDLNMLDTLFDTVSAFTTTGYSTGVVAKVNDFSKIVFVFTMFVGRIGPVSLMLSLTMKKAKRAEIARPFSDIMVG